MDDFRANSLRARKGSLVKKNMKKLHLTIILSLIVVSVSAHPAFNNKKAREYLQSGKLEAAEKELHLARFAQPQRAEIKYNLGFISYRKRNYKEASQYFADAAQNADSEKLRFNSLHNLGNSFYRQGNYAKAVEAYKNGLEIEQNAKTSYNLKKAEEMLKKQIEQQQKQQQNKERQQQNSKQKQQNQKQQNGDQQQKDGDQQQQQGQQEQGSKNGTKQNQKDNQSRQNQGQKDGRKNGDKSGKKQQNQQQGSKQSEQSKEKRQGQSEQGEQQMAESKQQERQDVQMGNNKGQQKNKPQASQRARALKNRKLNPYMVEKLLRELKEREKKGQLYYRNEPRRQEEMDPFSMDAHQLRDFFRNRGRGRRNKPKNDQPDW
jgi:tetratricopeptide (TPR) repeat protein